MVHRIQSFKPKLRKGASAVDTSGQKPALSYDSSSDIIMFKEESWFAIIAGWIKTFVMFALSAALIVGALYLIMAATLMLFTPVEGKLALVARGTFLGGNPSPGEVILASNDIPAADDPLSKMKDGTFGIAKSQILTVLSNPDAIITRTGSGITVNDGTSFAGTVTSPQEIGSQIQLVNQVAVQCIAGSCTMGDIFILDINLIYGEVRNVEEFTNGQ